MRNCSSATLATHLKLATAAGSYPFGQKQKNPAPLHRTHYWTEMDETEGHLSLYLAPTGGLLATYYTLDQLEQILSSVIFCLPLPPPLHSL